jgi:hypothetical protein
MSINHNYIKHFVINILLHKKNRYNISSLKMAPDKILQVGIKYKI